MSEYVSDDTFVQRQKEDIQELTSMFRDMLDNSGTDNEQEYLEEFRKVFVPQPGFEARYVINIEEKKNPLWIAIGSGALECGYGETEKPDLPEGVYVRHYEANEGRFPNSQNTGSDVSL